MKVIIRDAAFADLQGISAWIAKDNPRAARSVVERILDARSGA
jgi:plasmid stabilization system protein ParE